MPPPLPPRAHPDDLRSRLRSGGGYADRGPPRGGYRNDRYSPYGDVRGERRQAPPTLKGWSPSGNTRDDGKDTFAGKCEGCGNDCEVPFRPVKGGNPPVCNDCHQSLRSAQGGPDGGKRGRDPYGNGQQMMMVVTPQMMAAMQRGRGGRGMMGAGRGRGRGRGANVWTPDGAGGEGAGAAGGERKTPTKGPLSKTWVRPGAEIAGDDGAAAGAGGGINAPCTFFARGKCRHGEDCRFSHDPDLIAASQGDSLQGQQGDDDELPEIDMNE